MAHPKFIEIDGKRHLWRDLLTRRREQLAAVAKSEQPPLFEVKDDRRPTTDRTAAGRYEEPSLFGNPGREGRA